MKQLFQQSANIGLRTLVLIILSIALTIINQHVDAFKNFQLWFSSSVAYPFQITVDAPVRFLHWLDTDISNKRNLIHENEALRVRVILLQSHLQKMLSLEKENAQLRKMLQSTARISGHVAIARLLSVDLDPDSQRVVVNKGSAETVYQGQPVLDAFGVMGQVMSVSRLTSNILLITDKQSFVPVEDYRSGLRAIVQGLGVSGQLLLMNVPEDNDIQLGDLFVTSGLGNCFPVGYPVGMVSKIAHDKKSGEEKIYLTPSAHIDQTEQVLLVWPSA